MRLRLIKFLLINARNHVRRVWFFIFDILKYKNKKKEKERWKEFESSLDLKNAIRILCETIGGIVTFLATAYILVVTPGISSGLWLGEPGIPYGGVFFATALGAFLATLMMALLANLPVALAPGMGVNAFFVGTIIGIHGYTWQEALALSFLGGIIFLLISLTPIRRKLIGIPMT